MEPIQLTIITPFARYHEADGDLIVLPTKLGEIGLMRHHVPTIVSVVPGSLRYRIPSENGGEPFWRYLFVSAGYAEVGPDQVVVVTTAAEFAADIDVDRAQKALDRANARVNKPDATRRDLIHGRHAIRRAKNRLHVAELYGKTPGGVHPGRWDLEEEGDPNEAPPEDQD